MKAMNMFVPTEIPDYVARNGECQQLTTAIKLGLNTLLVGPTGGGKTHLVHWTCQQIRKPLITIQGNEGARSEDLVGYREVIEKNGASVTRWVDGLIPMAARIPGGAVLYIDEPSALPDGIRFALFSIMDDRRSIVLPENNNEVVKAQPGFVVIGAMNEGSGYVGTALGHSFRDRFGPVLDMDYLPKERETKLITDRVGIETHIATKLVEIGGMLRQALIAKEVRTPCSTRALLDCAKLIKAGLTPVESAKLTIMGKVPTNYMAERKSYQDCIEATLGNCVSTNDSADSDDSK